MWTGPVAYALALQLLPLDLEDRQSPMAFEPSEIGPSYVDLDATGRIDADTPKRLADYLVRLDRRRLLDGKVSIALDSDGGNLAAALEVGRLLRKWKIATTVRYGGRCLSSCAYAFLGGVVRYLPLHTDEGPGGPQSLIGFHRFYSEFDATVREAGDRSSATQLDQSEQSQITGKAVLEYLSEMGVDSAVLSYASSAAWKDMRFPDIDALKKTKVLSFNRVAELELMPDDGNVFAALGRFGLTDYSQLTIGCRPDGKRRPFVTLAISRPHRKGDFSAPLPVSPVWRLPRLAGRVQLRPPAGGAAAPRNVYEFGEGPAVQYVTGASLENSERKEILAVPSLDVRADPDFWYFTLAPSRPFLSGSLSSKYLLASIDGVSASGLDDRMFVVSLDAERRKAIAAVLKPCLG